jgi:hypothetical protein
MKTPNKHLTRLIGTATITGILGASCKPYSDNQIVISASLPAKGTHAMELDLTKDELDYLRFISKLSDDIVKHPVIAREFAKNPQLFIEKYGYNATIDLDENLMKLVLALGDEDINKAINAGDVKMVLKLMENKNLLNDFSNSYSSVNFSEEQTKEILTLMGVDIEDIECYSCTPAVFCVILLAVVFLYVGAVTIGAAALVAALGLALWVETATYGRLNYGSNFLEKNTPLKIWSLKGNSNDTYIAVDHYIEKQVDRVISIIKSHEESNIKRFDEKKMREFLKLNLLMQTHK